MDPTTRQPLIVSIPSSPQSLTFEFFKEVNQNLAMPKKNAREGTEEIAKAHLSLQIHHSASRCKQGAEIERLNKPQDPDERVDIATVSPEDIASRLSKYADLTQSYRFKSETDLNRYYDTNLGQQFYRDVEDDLKIKIVGRIYRGTRHIIFPDYHQVQEPSDLAMIKLRVPEAAPWQKVAKSIGAIPFPTPMGQVKAKLLAKEADAHENTLPTIEAYDLWDCTRQVVFTAHKIDALFVAVDLRIWASMKEEDQKALSNAVGSAQKSHDDRLRKEEEEMKEKLVARGVVFISPDIRVFKDRARRYYSSPSGWM